MNLDLSREALNLLKKISDSKTREFTRIVFDRTVKFEVDGNTLNDPSSTDSTSDWEHAKAQLLMNEFIEETASGIYKISKAGREYVDSHLK